MPSQLPKHQRRAKTAILLTGGNPQIAKAEGDAPVRAYIAAMPDWKRAIGRQLDALIVRTVPNVRKAVKWNSPFYGIEGRGWFLAFHVYSNYVKVTFFRGTSLRPVPPGPSQHKDVRYVDIRKGDDVATPQMASWVKQAAALPGWITSEPARAKRKPAPTGVPDWRATTLARMRALIHEAVPGITEERKWIKPTNPAGVLAWSHGGLVCTGETYKNVVKLTFARGASLPDRSRLFNAGLDGNTRRAIDIHEGETIDTRAFKALVKAAVAQNAASVRKR